MQTYYASGLNGQRLFVVPDVNLVVVNLVNTFERNSIAEDDVYELLDKILSARISQPKTEPALVPLEIQTNTPEGVTINYDPYIGEYEAPVDFDQEMDSISMSIRTNDKNLVVEIEYFGSYKLLPKSKKEFLISDMNFPLYFQFDQERVVGANFKLPLVLKEINFKKK